MWDYDLGVVGLLLSATPGELGLQAGELGGLRRFELTKTS